MSKHKGDRLITKLGKAAGGNPPDGAGRFDAAQVEQLLDAYYRHISPADLEEHDPQDLVGALIARLAADARAAPGEAKVRVTQPGSGGAWLAQSRHDCRGGRAGYAVSGGFHLRGAESARACHQAHHPSRVWCLA